MTGPVGVMVSRVGPVRCGPVQYGQIQFSPIRSGPIRGCVRGEFYHWHIDGGSHEMSHRQLVAIWYLNDVEGPGGETEFRHQAVKVTPEEGKLLLFPPFWTHEHRGAVLERGVKYIATTWVVFA